MHKLPPHLDALMGEANIKYARSEYDEAMRFCHEIIRQGMLQNCLYLFEIVLFIALALYYVL